MRVLLLLLVLVLLLTALARVVQAGWWSAPAQGGGSGWAAPAQGGTSDGWAWGPFGPAQGSG